MDSDAKDKQKIKEDAAVNLIKSRIEALYEDTRANIEFPEHVGLVERFWHLHQAHPNPHRAWLDYYKTLTDEDKHKLWQNYHLNASLPASIAIPIDEPKISPTERIRRPINQRPDRKKSLARLFFKSHVKPILSAALVVSMVWLVFNNELIVASVKQYLSPGDSQLSPTIIDPSVKVGKDPELIIPRINLDVPVDYTLGGREEDIVQKALWEGVVHYYGTGLPGQIGNNVIFGHSSGNLFSGGNYKFAFVHLNKVKLGDEIIVHYKGIRYVYTVTIRRVIKPNDFSLVQPTDVPTITLITCDPPGTNWRRLVVQAEQINPDPKRAEQVKTQTIEPDAGDIVPGNSQSLWSRFWGWLF